MKRINHNLIFVCGIIGILILIVLSIQLKRPITSDYNNTNSTNKPKEYNRLVSIEKDNITLNFGKKVDITNKKFPQLFNSFNYKNTQQFYTTALINYSTPNMDMTGSGQMLQIDRIVWVPATYTQASSLFYDLGTGTYLISPKEQALGRFPDTTIIATNPLIVRFRYDIAQPAFCYGYDCRGYWADFYEWDNGKSEFIEVNDKHKPYYKTLLAEYQNLNLNGCDAHYIYDIEQTGVKTLEAVYKSSKTNHCKDSTREELNKFMDYKLKLERL